MKNTVIVAILSMCLLAIQVNATVVVDFEPLGIGGNPGPAYIGTATYSEDGFDLATSSEFGYETISSSVVLYSRYANDTITLTRSDGEAFSLESIAFYPYAPLSATITFTATLEAGGTVTQSFANYSGDSTTVNFTNFNNITEVNWQAVGKYIKFDNITIVPEPFSFLLLASGYILIRRRTAMQ